MPERLEKYHKSEWRGLLFPFGKYGDPAPVGDDLEIVYSSILQILNTRRGERVLYPEFGCDLRSFLWEPYDTFTEREISGNILRAISLWEPRVIIDSVIIDNNSQNKNLGILVVSITLRIVNNPRQQRTIRVPISSQGVLFS